MAADCTTPHGAAMTPQRSSGGTRKHNMQHGNRHCRLPQREGCQGPTGGRTGGMDEAKGYLLSVTP